MKAPLIGILLALSLTGCQAAGLVNTPGGKTGANTNGSGTLTPLRLGSLQFVAASAETMARMSQQASGAAAPMSAESGARSADASAGTSTMIARPAIAPSPYGYGSYFGGPFGQMKLDGVQEAKAPGATGGFLALQASVIGPAVAEWASDARLVTTSGSLDDKGNPIAGAGSYPEENAWHATYASPSRSEVLEFHVGTDATRVVRLKWSPISLDAASVKIDAKTAVEKIAQAVASRVRTKEEELGRDYFFNANETGMVGGDARVGIAMPAIAPGVPSYDGPTTETLYMLKPGGRWYVNLQAIGEHLVWELNYNAYVNPGMTTGSGTVSSGSVGVAVSPDAPVSSSASTPAMEPIKTDMPYQPQPWVDENAYGMIDARTGDLIRLRRPTKYTYSGVNATEPAPAPRPMDVKQ